MPNHLTNANSPYLLQHAHNPVDWHPWGDEALAKAKAENKPIFLSIGYAACHWCHVMAHESFEDPNTAALMNEHFINIKVDREERPDIDAIYMQAVVAMTGSGGWPMSVFLTPDLKPFFAGTYFPPTRRYNMPAFTDVLTSVSNAWQNKKDEIERVGNQLKEYLQSAAQSAQISAPITREELRQCADSLLNAYDWGYGGWGEAPKFPQPMALEFLLRQSIRDEESKHLKAARHALNAMARGGMYDVVGGGFARYSVDNFWRVPHFEKMLYDNALLALVYLRAWQITKNDFFKQIVIETLDFVAREMTHPDGGFYSSLDADSEGKEGKFYVWTQEEIRAILKDDSEFFEAAYGISARGNWEGVTILQRALDDANLAARFKLDPQTVRAQLADSRLRLLSARGERIRPNTDDKILASWNGLMLHAFAEAARVLDDEGKAKTYLQIATRNAEFLLSAMRPQGHLRRAWRDGKTTDAVFLEDYAALIIGLIELYQTDFDNKWFVEAMGLAEEMIQRFSESANQRGGFFDTPNDGETLLVRPRDIQDNATPSGSALACEALLKLAAFTDNGNYRDIAEGALAQISDMMMKYPLGFARWLSAADFARENSKQIAVVYEAWGEQFESLIEVIRSEYRPHAIVSASVFPPAPDSPALLKDKPLLNGAATVYVCEGFVCKQPVHSPDELSKQLD